MIIDQILIEYWSRLQSANFCILLSKPFTDVQSVKIHLRDSQIYLSYNSSELCQMQTITIDLTKFFNIKTHSLSLLMIKTNYLSFRINTTNTLNNFDEELLRRPVELNGNCKRKVSKPNVLPKELIQLICSNCTAPLTKLMSFQRVLELPSENLDVSDWFCHKTHDTAEEDTKFNFTKFEPRTMDLLYGQQFFILLNAEHLQNLKTKCDSIHCKRCLQYVGDNIPKKKSMKLWNENVKVQHDTNVKPLFGSQRTSILDHFRTIIEQIIYDYNFLVSTPQNGMSQSMKILLECGNNRKSEKYLFIQIMNKNLVMLKKENENHEACMKQDSIVNLIKVTGHKVLFHVENLETKKETNTAGTKSALVDFWQNDPSVSHSQISQKMFDCAVDNLHENSKLVPECYRSCNGGFLLSYVFH